MTTILDVEPIEWIAVSEALPDDDVTVLVSATDTKYPVWLGWFEDERWRTIEGGSYRKGQVTAWAPMPKGPERC
jgi:hypothetical protein